MICVGAFWESSTLRLIRLLYYDCRWVIKMFCSLCQSEKYCIRAGTGSLSLHFSLQLSILHSKKVIFLRAALLTERSLRPSWHSSFLCLIVSWSFHHLYRSISLLLFILSKIRKVSLECVISLTIFLSL